MIVIPGPSSTGLGEKIASELGIQSHPVDHRIFPDGESYIRLTTPVKGETAVVVQTAFSRPYKPLMQTTFPCPDRSLMQLFLLAGTARDLGAERVVCVVPYLAYSRQDKRFLDGEALSLDLVVSLLEKAGGDELVVVEAHNEESLDRVRASTGLEVANLSAMSILAEGMKRMGFEGAYSLSPDKGAIRLAEAAAGVLGGKAGFFEKRRDRRTGEIEMVARDVEIGEEGAVVFDDIISSGGTTAMAVRCLKGMGVGRVAAACTHGLFMGNAEERIREAGADLIVSTDTIQSSLTEVTVAGLIADYLRKRF